jgi:hypothetical protein
MIPVCDRAARNCADRGRVNKTLCMALACAPYTWYQVLQKKFPGDLVLIHHPRTYSLGVRRTVLRIDQVYPLQMVELGLLAIRNCSAVYIPSLYALNVRNAMSSISPVNISQLITLDQEKIKCRTKMAVNNSDDCHA